MKQVNPVMTIRHLQKSFGNNHVLAGIDLTLQRGENVVILGRSGVGKSVLIKCVIGLIEPDEGQVLVLEKNIFELDHEELDKVRARVGFLFQGNALYDSLTVRGNLEFPMRRHWIKVSQEEMNHLVMETLEDVGLAHTVDMMPAELSGGMRKRIALARTLIMKPEIILYDEPTTGLDPITGKEIIELIITIQKKYKASSLIISHDMTCVRLAADRIIVLTDGICYADGTYETLKRSADPKIKPFFDSVFL